MVFHYTIRGGPCKNANSNLTLSSSDITCYVGRDKHENEFLIKYGWPGDIWFHVDGLSSAHVYFRVCTDAAPVAGVPIDDLPEDSVYDMMQIVKNNSISGCKLASTKIVYTPHSNLKKTFEMESGTVTYHDTKLCRYQRCSKDKDRVKELERTKTERVNVNFFEEMKANERRIVEKKRRHRMENEMYDPMRDDLRTSKMKATRQGDEESGLDKGVAALEGLSLAPASASFGPSASDAANADLGETRPENPVWVDEEESRSLEPNSDVRFLRARGYTSLEALGALESGESRIEALRKLWHSNSGGVTSFSTSSEITAEVVEARQEEKEVLIAIFGEDDGIAFSDDESLFDATIPITSYEPPSRYGSPPPLLLEVYVDSGIAPLYPNEPPVLALVGGGLPETLLTEFTNQLRMETLRRAEEEPGEPQIFNLLGFIGEELPQIIEEETAKLESERKLRVKEEAAEAEMERKAEIDKRKLENSDEPPSQPTSFKSDEDRRAYAKEVLSKSNCLKADDTKKKNAPAGARYNTGVSDQSLINDLFG